jgi:hypothetical protein
MKPTWLDWMQRFTNFDNTPKYDWMRRRVSSKSALLGRYLLLSTAAADECRASRRDSLCSTGELGSLRRVNDMAVADGWVQPKFSSRKNPTVEPRRLLRWKPLQLVLFVLRTEVNLSELHRSNFDTQVHSRSFAMSHNILAPCRKSIVTFERTSSVDSGRISVEKCHLRKTSRIPRTEGSSSDLKLQMGSVVTEVPQTSPLLVWRASGREKVPRMRSEVAACPLQHAEYDKRDNRDNLGTMQMMLATICSSAGQSG